MYSGSNTLDRPSAGSWSGTDRGRKYMPEQLDSTTSIASTQNDSIHGIQLSRHTTFNRLNHSASNRKHGSINICGVDCTTSKSNHFNLQMLWWRSPPKSMLGLAMIVELKIVCQYVEHCSTGIFSNVFGYIGHISHLGDFPVLNRCSSQTRKVAESSAI
jgi:hypothetical protein